MILNRLITGSRRYGLAVTGVSTIVAIAASDLTAAAATGAPSARPSYLKPVGAHERSQQALFELGMRYLEQGKPATANLFFRAAAETGYAPALTALADGYLSGDGIAKNGTKALICYVLAADQGYGPAQLVLGFVLRNAEAGVTNPALAAHYLRRATGWEDETIAAIAQEQLRKHHGG